MLKGKAAKHIHIQDAFGIHHSIATYDSKGKHFMDVKITTIYTPEGTYYVVPDHISVADLQHAKYGGSAKEHKFTFWESRPEVIKAVADALAIVADWIMEQEKKRDAKTTKN